MNLFDQQVEVKKLSFTLSIESDVPKLVFSDQKRFKQVLLNIIANSVKYTFKGCIEIEVVKEASSNDCENCFQCVLNIMDSGIGMSP